MSHVISPSTSDNTTEGRASRPLQVAEAMKQFVVSEGLQAGDKLPSEAELMALALAWRREPSEKPREF